MVLAASGARAQQSTSPAKVFNTVGIDQKLDNPLPLELAFRDETGKTVPLSTYFHNRPVVLALVYYECPMLCTQVLNGMVETFRTMDMTVGKDFDVVTVSIDPKEQPALAAEKKTQYLKKYGRAGAEEGWHFLTGEEPNIRALADSVGFRYVYDETSGQYAHAAGIMVVTPEGNVARYLFGIEFGAKDLKFALMEATQERIGSPVDQLLLLCYCYNPATGKYSLVVTNLLRIGGLVTIVLLGGFMIVANRRSHRRKVAISRN
jgi:protein SCO1